MRSYRCADCDMEHFLVICKFRLKLQRASTYYQKTPKFNIDELKERENKWFNNECRKAVEKRNEARQKYLQLNTTLSEENYEAERRTCKRSCREKKETTWMRYCVRQNKTAHKVVYGIFL